MWWTLFTNLLFGVFQAQYEQEDDYVYNEKVTWEKVRIVASTFSNWCVVLQGLPGSLPWGVLLTFLNDYLAQDQKLTTEQATAVSSLISDLFQNLEILWVLSLRHHIK